MIRVELELSSSDHEVFDVANWVAATLGEEMPIHMKIHRITVEESDA